MNLINRFFRFPKYLSISAILIAGCHTTVETGTGSTSGSVKLESIPIELTTISGEQQTFFEGEEVQFLLSLGSDAYVVMYHIDADGDLVQMLPDERQPDNFYKAGYFMTIPEYVDGYRFIVDDSFGKELIWVIASDTSFAPDTSAGDISDIRTKIKEYARKEYGEFVFELKTSER